MDKDNYYDAISEGYEELHLEEQLKKISLIKKYFVPKECDKLLDVGCGTGVTTEFWNCKRYGIDPAKKLIERARDKENIIYKVAAAESIPYPDKYFDHVISITALQNFSDISKGLDEIKRVGKNSFILTFLKRSSKNNLIDKLIREKFVIVNVLEEDKDMIYLCKS